MLHQLFNFSRSQHFYLACSGGVDSMAIADFYRRGNKNFSLAYFHHGTSQADQMLQFLSEWSQQNNIPLVKGYLSATKDKSKSPEEFWRDERYAWLKSLNDSIITCHHLNDVAETWIFSSLHGNPKLIAPRNENVYRPFLLNPKVKLIEWCQSHQVSWVEDLSNQDIHYPRNYIRHQLLPQSLKVNPGLLNTLKRKYLKSLGNVSTKKQR